MLESPSSRSESGVAIRFTTTELAAIWTLLFFSSACASTRVAFREARAAPQLVTSDQDGVERTLSRHVIVQEEEEESGEEETEGKNVVFLFLGGTYKEDLDASIGLGYERLITPKVGLGILLEGTPSVREPVLLFPRLAVNPFSKLILILSPGLEFEHEVHPLIRTGIGWEFELGEPYGLSFEINYDFVANHEDAIVGGLSFFYLF